MRSAAKSSSILSAAPTLAIALLLLPSSVSGQGNSSSKPSTQYPGSTPRNSVRPPSIREREFQLRALEMDAANPAVTENAKLTLSQIAKDYREIQLVNNTMLSEAIPAPEPNYSKIVDATTDIKGCANRLKSNLGLVKVGKESAKAKRRSASNSDEIKADLLSLDRYIISFVKNPIFNTFDVLNVEHAAKARADLETIIELSQLISKDAEKLKKATPRPR